MEFMCGRQTTQREDEKTISIPSNSMYGAACALVSLYHQNFTAEGHKK